MGLEKIEGQAIQVSLRVGMNKCAGPKMLMAGFTRGEAMQVLAELTRKSVTPKIHSIQVKSFGVFSYVALPPERKFY